MKTTFAGRWDFGSGFKANDMFVDNIFPYRIQDYVQYRYVKEW
jgi:hypothetical protein